MNIQQAKIKKLQAEIDLKNCLLKELEEEFEKSMLEEIKDGPVSHEEIVGKLIRENGFPQLTGGYGVAHFDLKKFVKEGEKNHSKRTQPLIDLVVEFNHLFERYFSGSTVGTWAAKFKQALKTLEENEI